MGNSVLSGTMQALNGSRFYRPLAVKIKQSIKHVSTMIIFPDFVVCLHPAGFFSDVYRDLEEFPDRIQTKILFMHFIKGKDKMEELIMPHFSMNRCFLHIYMKDRKYSQYNSSMWMSTSLWIKSSRVVRASDSQSRIVTTVLGSITASSDTVESEGRQTKQCWISYTLIKKKIKFSSYIGKFRVEQLQSHIWGRAS